MRVAIVGFVLFVLGAAAFWAWRTAVPATGLPNDGSAAGNVAAANVDERGVDGQHAAAASQAHDPTPTTSERTAVAIDPEHAATYRFVVVDEDHRPLPDVEVSWLDNPAAVVHSGADGRVRLPVRKGEPFYLLRFELGPRHRQHHRLPPDDDESEVMLRAAGVVRARCIDHDTSAPIAGVLVQHHHISCKQCEPDTARTGDDGRFELPAVTRGANVAFAFEVDGYAHQYALQTFPGSGEPVDCEFRLRRGVVVAGRFVDLETREPVAGAVVRKEGRELARSAADGTFSMRLLPDVDGGITAHVNLDGYCEHLWTFTEGTAPTPYPLVRSVSVTGTVRSEAGGAVAGARVFATEVEKGHPAGLPERCTVRRANPNQRTASDAQGKFALHGFVPTSMAGFVVRHDDYVGWSDRVAVPLPQTEPVVLTLKGAARPQPAGYGSIRGTWTVNGQPGTGSIAWQAAGRRGGARVGTDGTFALDDVPVGEVLLRATSNRYDRVSGGLLDRVRVERTLQLDAGAPHDLELTLTIEEHTVTGRVTRADGSAVVSQAVSAVGGTEFASSTRTDAEGRFSLLVPAFVQAVDVSAGRDCEPQQREAAPGATDVDFVAPLAGQLRYRIRNAEGRQVSPELTLTRIGGDESAAPSHELSMHDSPGPDGFRTTTLPFGTYDATISRRGFAPTQRRITIGHEAATIDATLSAGHTATVRLANDAAEPPPGLRVLLLIEGIDERVSLRSYLAVARSAPLTRDGNPLPNLPDGIHRLQASDASLELVPNTIEIRSADVELDLHWRKAEGR